MEGPGFNVSTDYDVPTTCVCSFSSKVLYKKDSSMKCGIIYSIIILRFVVNFVMHDSFIRLYIIL